MVGRDPRASGEMLEAAVIAGVTSEGVDALRVGVLPTPAVAYLTSAYDADFGVMISRVAQPDARQRHQDLRAGRPQARRRHRGPHRGAASTRARAAGRPAPASAASSTPKTRWTATCATPARRVTTRLDGLTVVVDCAHGAASAAAPRAYRAAGADVIAINAEPDGLNINDGCGSTHMEQLQAAVVSHGADLGLAHDGDADRCLAVDAAGRVDRRRRHHGDPGAGDAGRRASWRPTRLVATVMSNLGLHLAMRAAGIEVRTTGVGDRYVLEELQGRRVFARR